MFESGFWEEGYWEKGYWSESVGVAPVVSEGGGSEWYWPLEKKKEIEKVHRDEWEEAVVLSDFDLVEAELWR